MCDLINEIEHGHSDKTLDLLVNCQQTELDIYCQLYKVQAIMEFSDIITNVTGNERNQHISKFSCLVGPVGHRPIAHTKSINLYSNDIGQCKQDELKNI